MFYAEERDSMTKQTGYPHIDKPWMKYYENANIDYQTTVDTNTNVTEYLKQKNEDTMNAVASTYYGNKTTYKEFFEQVDSYSKMFSSLGVKKGDRIMKLVPNIPESGKMWLGASQIGAVSDFADPRPDSLDIKANAKKILELIKFEKANYIVALDKCYLGMLKPIEHELKELGIQQILTVSATDSITLMGKIDYLRDVLQYQKLKNIRIGANKIQQLKSYEAVLQKLKSMKTENEYYKEAVKTSSLEILRCQDLLKETENETFTKVYDPDLINYIGHTSGTSGARPKPITLTNGNHISSAEQLFQAGANFRKEDKILHILPFFSPMGADNNYILNLASGSNNLEIPEFEINEVGYLIKKYKPNVLLGPPSWILGLLKCQYLQKEDLSCIHRIIYGGDAMTEEDIEKVNRWLKEHNCSAVVETGHGMSEYCGCGSYAHKTWNKPNTMGIPLPDTIYTIVDPNVDDKLVPLRFNENEKYLSGELVVSSPAVTPGTLDGEIIVPHFDLDGNSYIRTRDLVKMDRTGVFSFDSRKDRSFTRFDGYKVKPYKIEQAIEKNEKVKYCRIVQYYDDKQRGFMPMAHIVLENEEPLSKEEKVELTKEIVYEQIINNPDMTSRQIPTKFKFRESMPLTKNSKINFNALIEEGLTGDEINVDIAETNLSVGEIKIYSNPSKIKMIKR